MPFPKLGTERARPDLAETLVEYDLIANMNSMVAFDVMPIREVGEFKGTFGRVKAKQMLKAHPNAQISAPGEEFRRAPRAAYPQDDTEFEEDTYETQEYGLEGPVDDNEAAAYRSYFEQETFVTQHINNKLMTATEKRVAAATFNTTTFTTGAGMATAIPSGERWQNQATATPIKHVKNAMFAVYAKSGIWPDSIVFNRFAWLHLIDTDEIRERVHSQGAGSPDRASLITREIVGQIFQVPNIIVAGGTMDNANPNAAFSPAQIWGPHAMVFKRAMTRNLTEIALGRTFHWAIDSSMPTGYVETYRKSESRGDQIRIRHQMQNKIIYAEVGHLLTDVYA